jgi:hypothetical protein
MTLESNNPGNIGSQNSLGRFVQTNVEEFVQSNVQQEESISTSTSCRSSPNLNLVNNPILERRSRPCSASSSVGDPTETILRSNSKSPLYYINESEPANIYVSTSTILISKKRLEELEKIEKNIDKIISDALKEYIQLENLQ